VPSNRPSLSLSGSSALMRPSPSVSSAGFGSWPSITPSSSLSASFGSVPIAPRARRSGRRRRCRPRHERRPAPLTGRRIASRRVERAVVVRSPRRRRCAPPPSVSASSGLVVVDGSASAVQLPAATSVAGFAQSLPSSVPSQRPSSSLSGSSALMRPSPSVSAVGVRLLAVEHAVVVGVGVVRVAAERELLAVAEAVAVGVDDAGVVAPLPYVGSVSPASTAPSWSGPRSRRRRRRRRCRRSSGLVVVEPVGVRDASGRRRRRCRGGQR
jgi:hypothetical protein